MFILHPILNEVREVLETLESPSGPHLTFMRESTMRNMTVTLIATSTKEKCIPTISAWH